MKSSGNSGLLRHKGKNEERVRSRRSTEDDDNSNGKKSNNGKSTLSVGVCEARRRGRRSLETEDMESIAEALAKLEMSEPKSSMSTRPAKLMERVVGSRRSGWQTQQSLSLSKMSRLPRMTSVSSGPILLPMGADEHMVRSGHAELNTLFASNDIVTRDVTVNVCNAPNDSTVQCGCENINCPFCNLLLSIQKTDPNVLQ